MPCPSQRSALPPGQPTPYRLRPPHPAAAPRRRAGRRLPELVALPNRPAASPYTAEPSGLPGRPSLLPAPTAYRPPRHHPAPRHRDGAEVAWRTRAAGTGYNYEPAA
ncbi:hypothetical protein BS78_06G181800 [Paspalum vaginatum]|nr:hypothetical protein BS78_06G181800 [Paspalum vaginatum]